MGSPESQWDSAVLKVLSTLAHLSSSVHPNSSPQSSTRSAKSQATAHPSAATQTSLSSLITPPTPSPLLTTFSKSLLTEKPSVSWPSKVPTSQALLRTSSSWEMSSSVSSPPTSITLTTALDSPPLHKVKHNLGF